MRQAKVFVHNKLAGFLTEETAGTAYNFAYLPDYIGPPVSLTMPITEQYYSFDRFPAFFDGLLPEGPQLEGLLRYGKLDRYDHFGQLMQVGHNLVGAVTVEEIIV